MTIPAGQTSVSIPVTINGDTVFEGDGLASSRGRAFDLSARYVLDFSPQISGFAGIRMLDGGTNGSSAYNFARFNYLTFGLQYRL